MITYPLGWLEYDSKLNLHDNDGATGVVANLEAKAVAEEILTALNAKLNPVEQNFVKDIVKAIGNDATLNAQFAQALGLEQVIFDNLADEIFKKCQNGRLTVEGE